VSSLVGYFLTLAKVGGPVLAFAGVLVWYQDRRATEDHDSEQAQLDRLQSRIETGGG